MKTHSFINGVHATLQYMASCHLSADSPLGQTLIRLFNLLGQFPFDQPRLHAAAYAPINAAIDDINVQAGTNIPSLITPSYEDILRNPEASSHAANNTIDAANTAFKLWTQSGEEAFGQTYGTKVRLLACSEKTNQRLARIAQRQEVTQATVTTEIAELPKKPPVPKASEVRSTRTSAGTLHSGSGGSGQSSSTRSVLLTTPRPPRT